MINALFPFLAYQEGNYILKKLRIRDNDCKKYADKNLDM